MTGVRASYTLAYTSNSFSILGYAVEVAGYETCTKVIQEHALKPMSLARTSTQKPLDNLKVMPLISSLSGWLDGIGDEGLKSCSPFDSRADYGARL